MPAGTVFTDPETGSGIAAGRERGTVVLMVTEPPAVDPAERREAIRTSYLLGTGAAPSNPPLFRRIGPASEPAAVRMTFRQIAAMLHFNSLTGTLETR